MTSCRMCANLGMHTPGDAWDKPLLESENFVALPSLGALVRGWLLLVPRQHYISMGALPGPLVTEMQEMKQLLCSVAQENYGQPCIFEHGPSMANCAVGCGVDHAHLHVVPVPFDLASAVVPFVPADATWSKAGIEECRGAFLSGKDYLYLEQPAGIGRIISHRALGSQLFRRAIASGVGVKNRFDWREYPELPNVMATIEKVRAWADTISTCQSCPGAAV
jgi:ATP adenylyltransferase